MSSGKQERNVAELEMPYEPNEISLGAIVKFAVGLFIMIVVTFVLMWVLYGLLEQNAVDNFGPTEPMGMTDKEQLPPEPRLQSAPGFGVDTDEGRVNLELTPPQAEYQVLKEEWTDLIENGQKHPVTGSVIAMPVEEAKTVYLGLEKKANKGPEAEKLAAESKKYVSDAASGRVASATR